MKKLIALIIILTFLIAYITIAVQIGGILIHAPKLVLMLYYVIAGIAWALPLKPVLDWVNKT